MSHLSRWSCSCLFSMLALGTIKPHVRRLNARPAFSDPPPNKEDHARYACNIRASQIGLQGVPGPSQLTSRSV
jgi:hypothetical protein